MYVANESTLSDSKQSQRIFSVITTQKSQLAKTA